MKIKTELVNKEIEQALLGDLNKMWEVFSSLEGDREFEKELEKVKSGINTMFDIRSITEGEFQMETAFNRVRIERKQIVDITKYRDEIDERKKLMKRILRSIYTDDFDNQREEEIKGYE